MRGPMRLPFFYGWVLVAIAFVTMAVGVNARTAFSLLFPPILDEFGWDRGVTAGIFSFGFLISALITPFVGRLIDQPGPALTVASSGVGVGSVTLLPWLQSAIESGGWRAACWTLGLLVFVLLAPLNLLL